MQAFEFVDIFVAAGLSLALASMLWWHHKKTSRVLGSISQTVAASRRKSLMFSLTMSVAYPLYYLWLWLWVGPSLMMPSAYYIVLVFSAVAELIFVWVPATDGVKRRVHETAAAFVGLAMLILPALILLNVRNPSELSKAVIFVYFGVCAVLLVLLASTKYRRHTFTYEVIYCLAFLVAMSVVGRVG